MQKPLIATIATVTIVITLAAAAFAGLTKPLTVNVPFEFMVSGKTLPAGPYAVIRNTQNIVILTNRENHVSVGALVLQTDESKSTQASLTFHRYGKDHFLAQISDGTSAGVTLPTSKAERAAAKNNTDFLARKTTPEIISLPVQVGN